MLKFINIHSHSHILPPENEIRIQNVDLVNLGEKTIQKYSSLGLHPWSVVNYPISDDIIGILVDAVKKNPQIIAIGETGFDKLISTPIRVQENIFKKHIKAAQILNVPLIIHCVKAFNELEKSIKEMHFEGPVIIHGFNNNLNIAHHILKQGYYLSFRNALLHEGSNAINILKEISFDRFFLENDDQQTDITAIYEAAAHIKNISLNELLQNQNHNFETVFKIKAI